MVATLSCEGFAKIPLQIPHSGDLLGQDLEVYGIRRGSSTKLSHIAPFYGISVFNLNNVTIFNSEYYTPD